jgi:hypothetical protein
MSSHKLIYTYHGWCRVLINLRTLAKPNNGNAGVGFLTTSVGNMKSRFEFQG